LLQGDFLEDGDFYIESNGRIVAEDDVFLDGHRYYMHLRVLGGKGGMAYISVFIYFVPHGLLQH